MTSKQIIEMARQAGFGYFLEPNWQLHEEVIAFAKLVAEHEREACAKICDEFCYGSTKILVEKAIQARGEA